MKKLSLAVACSSLLLSPIAFSEEAEVPEGLLGTSYITGNLQRHDSNMHGSSMTSTLEAGHTFTTGTTLLVEFDGIQVGDLKTDENAPAYITLGAEQAFNVTNDFWVAVGYHYLSANGNAVQHRPLFKLGYNFDNGISISNRTRFHIDAVDNNDDTRMDNAIAYAIPSQPIAVKYNNVYMIDSEAMDHELRATWTRAGVQPYVEYRSQGNNVDNQDANNAFVIGASYAF
ncbi:porin [Psychromonas marina]|uniref:Porin n=1 Tax=Psychromonas marina TaxID=88364 RepID=A0ABQ6E0Z4_9GAMM|nr:oligogalacturonate-specific porin KdgM family protein [Psychromonas marina]GLS90875.1 porin [Psychromonas marina]